MATITPYVTSFLNTASYEPTTGLNLPPLSKHTEGIVVSMYKKMETEYPLHVLLPFIYHQLARSHEEPRPPVPAGWSENTSTAGGISKINYLHQDSGKQISLISESLDPNQANAGMLFSFTDTLILGVGASISYRVTTEIASSPGPDSPGQLSIRIKFNPDLMAIAQSFFGNETHVSATSYV